MLEGNADEVRELFQVLNFSDFVFAHVQMSQRCQRVKIFDFLVDKSLKIFEKIWKFRNYSDFVVTNFEHRQIAKGWKILNNADFVRAQEKFLQVHKCFDVLNFLQAIEADVEMPERSRENLHNVSEEIWHEFYLRLTRASKFSILVIWLS